jgi:hypothetical protein
MSKKTYDKPSDVIAEGGWVLVDDPDQIDVALAPDAAVETGGFLIDEPAVAVGQERAMKFYHRPKQVTVKGCVLSTIVWGQPCGWPQCDISGRDRG